MKSRTKSEFENPQRQKSRSERIHFTDHPRMGSQFPKSGLTLSAKNGKFVVILLGREP
jgi:hypothetical protein